MTQDIWSMIQKHVDYLATVIMWSRSD